MYRHRTRSGYSSDLRPPEATGTSLIKAARPAAPRQTLKWHRAPEIRHSVAAVLSQTAPVTPGPRCQVTGTAVCVCVCVSVCVCLGESEVGLCLRPRSAVSLRLGEWRPAGARGSNIGSARAAIGYRSTGWTVVNTAGLAAVIRHPRSSGETCTVSRHRSH